MHQSPKGTFLTMREFVDYKDRFELPNLVKAKKKRQQMWGWHKLPDLVEHYKVVWLEVKVPVGIAWHLRWFERHYNNPEVKIPQPKLKLYDEQNNALNKLLMNNYGLLHASTWTGKTVMLCEIAHRIKRKTLIVVDALSRMTQMVDDIEKILGLKVPYIWWTQKKSYVPDTDMITVLNIDSRDKVTNIESFGLIIFDEADRYLQADARREWVGSLSPEYMYALTGTVTLNDVHNGVFKIYYWPKTEYLLKHYTPKYFQVVTDFEYQLDNIKEFTKMKTALYEDERRNALILHTIVNTLGNRKGIVFCEYVEHSKVLVQALKDFGIEAHMIIGEVSPEEREAVRQRIKDSTKPTILVGSVKCIWRWFDLPELSVWYMTTAEKFNANIEQYIWRIVRKFPWKETCEWYDFVDMEQGMLYRQSINRLQTAKKAFPWLNPHLFYR